MFLTEKYRPSQLDQIVGQAHITSRVAAFVENVKNGNAGDFPHLGLFGPQGIGKTTMTLAIAREIYGKDLHKGFLELNASDQRGIKVVREEIKNFCKLAPPMGYPIRVIGLDEADHMTAAAQHAMRRTMELYPHARFILTGNYSSSIIAPIQSRLAVFKFRPLRSEDVFKRLVYICKQERIRVTRDGLNSIIQYCEGDLRAMINTLNAVSSGGHLVNKKEVETVLQVLTQKETREIIKICTTEGNFQGARLKLRDIIYNRGVSANDVLKRFHTEILDHEKLSDPIKADMIDLIGELDLRLKNGGQEEIQISCLLTRLIALTKKK